MKDSIASVGLLGAKAVAEQGLYSEHRNVKKTAHYVAQLANQYGVESETLFGVFTSSPCKYSACYWRLIYIESRPLQRRRKSP